MYYVLCRNDNVLHTRIELIPSSYLTLPTTNGINHGDAFADCLRRAGNSFKGNKYSPTSSTLFGGIQKKKEAFRFIFFFEQPNIAATRFKIRKSPSFTVQ